MVLIGKWLQTDAKVVRVDITHGFSDTLDDELYTTIYEYNVDGTTYTLPDYFENEKKHEIGDVVEIVYNPENPKKFMLANKQKKAAIKQKIKLVTLGIIILFIIWIYVLFH